MTDIVIFMTEVTIKAGSLVTADYITQSATAHQVSQEAQNNCYCFIHSHSHPLWFDWQINWVTWWNWPELDRENTQKDWDCGTVSRNIWKAVACPDSILMIGTTAEW